MAVVIAMMFCAGLASSYCYAATGAMLRRWLAEGQRLLHFNRLMALALTAPWMGDRACSCPGPEGFRSDSGLTMK